MDELKNRLLEDYKYRFELHAHSHPASPCSEFVSSEFVEMIFYGVEALF